MDRAGTIVTNVSVSDVRGLAAIAAAGGDVDTVLDESAVRYLSHAVQPLLPLVIAAMRLLPKYLFLRGRV